MNRVRPTETRRRFLARSAAIAGVIACPAVVDPCAIGIGGHPGANERVRIAVIGMGARGQNLIGNLPEAARVTAICDCARSRIERTFAPQGKFVAILAGFLGGPDAKSCARYQDVRRLLDREKLDGLMITTPDHNHAWIAMLAMAAGLDLYLEKPLTLTIPEGRALVEAARRTRRVVQVGSQQRSMELNRFACEFVRDGGLGKISHVDERNFAGPMVDPALPAETIPDGMDWDLFCGPRPLRPYHEKRWVKDELRVGDLLWRGWDLWRDYSGHLMTNWGAHSLDMVQYALGRDETGPIEIQVTEPDDIEIAAADHTTMTPTDSELGLAPANRRRFWPVTMRYSDGVEIRCQPGQKVTVVHGERGRMVLARNRFEVEPKELVRDPPDPALAAKWVGPGHVARPHVANWLDAIKTRGAPNAPIEVGHRSNSVCLLANLARELARPLRWDPSAERFAGDDEANAQLDRPRREGFELAKL